MAPPSQKRRTIGFHLSGGGGGDVDFTFGIRPADLTRQEPSRLNVVQTLGGAWADAFDRGLSTITLSGNNGWRGGSGGTGESLFADLRDTVFTEWHSRRQDAVDGGTDPGDVELVFVDTLDKINVIVAPQTFELRRSKAEPLLMQYRIVLVVLDDASSGGGILDSITSALSNPLRWLASVTGLGNALTFIQSAYARVRGFFSDVQGAVDGFVIVGVSLLGKVQSLASGSNGIFDATLGPILASALTLSQASSNAFRALAAGPSLPGLIKADLMEIASNFNDAYCSMSNGFNVGRYFTSYDDLFGASTCSSTGGGRTFSTFTEEQANPLYQLYPPVASRVAITPAAQAGLATLRQDPILLSAQPAVVTQAMGSVASGMTVAA